MFPFFYSLSSAVPIFPCPTLPSLFSHFSSRIFPFFLYSLLFSLTKMSLLLPKTLFVFLPFSMYLFHLFSFYASLFRFISFFSFILPDLRYRFLLILFLLLSLLHKLSLSLCHFLYLIFSFIHAISISLYLFLFHFHSISLCLHIFLPQPLRLFFNIFSSFALISYLTFSLPFFFVSQLLSMSILFFLDI